jgi:hypothetical protein
MVDLSLQACTTPDLLNLFPEPLFWNPDLGTFANCLPTNEPLPFPFPPQDLFEFVGSLADHELESLGSESSSPVDLSDQGSPPSQFEAPGLHASYPKFNFQDAKPVCAPVFPPKRGVGRPKVLIVFSSYAVRSPRFLRRLFSPCPSQ